MLKVSSGDPEKLPISIHHHPHDGVLPRFLSVRAVPLSDEHVLQLQPQVQSR